jgi:hypothetical protein
LNAGPIREHTTPDGETVLMMLREQQYRAAWILLIAEPTNARENYKVKPR